MCNQDVASIGDKYKTIKDKSTHAQVDKQRTKNNIRNIQQSIGLRQLAKAVNGKEYIPYDKLKSVEGFMTDSMSVRISRRKREIEAEMADIEAIGSKYGIIL